MKYLLDTHIILWSVTQPERLTREVADILRDARHELWCSPISAWEILILAEKQRIRLLGEPRQSLRKIMGDLGLIEAPLTVEVAIRSRLLDLSHQDPADRFIAATAIVYGLTLITADERLLASTEIPLLPNT